MLNNDICIHWVGRKEFTQLKVQIDSRPTTVDREYLQYDRNQVRSPKRLISFKRNRQTKILVPVRSIRPIDDAIVCEYLKANMANMCDVHTFRNAYVASGARFDTFIFHLIFPSFHSFPLYLNLVPSSLSLSSIRICPLNVWWQRRDGDKKNVSPATTKSVKNEQIKRASPRHWMLDVRIHFFWSENWAFVKAFRFILCTEYSIDFILLFLEVRSTYIKRHCVMFDILNAKWCYSISHFCAAIFTSDFFYSMMLLLLLVYAVDITVEPTWFDSVIQFLVFDLKSIFTISGNHLPCSYTHKHIILRNGN